MFKAKGEKHSVRRSKTPVHIAPEVVTSIADFVAMFVTEGRCLQGLEAIGGEVDRRLTGAFLKWMNQDVQKESIVELDASALEWAQVQDGVTRAARVWFFSRGA